MKEKHIVKKGCYSIAAFFFAGWLIGFFLLGAGTLIHSLIVISLIFCLEAVMITPKFNPKNKL